MDIFIQYAIAASQFAMDDAGAGRSRRSIAPRVGVFIASGIGGFTTIEREHKALLEGGPRKISPFFIPSAIINLAAGQVSIRFGAKGPNSATCTACSASAHAIGDAFEIIRRGAADVMIAGGSEAAITPMGDRRVRRAARAVDAQRRAGAGQPAVRQGSRRLHRRRRRRRADPRGATSRRSARGARIYAELVGYGMSADAYHITAPSEDGDGAVPRDGARRSRAPASSRRQVDYINAHGTSTPHGDKLETLAIKRCFGDHASELAVSSTKSMTGHLLGAAGGLEAGITALAVHHQIAPPTINLDEPDAECDLDYVPNVKRALADRVRAVELVRLRRHQRGAAVQAISRHDACQRRSSSRDCNHLTTDLVTCNPTLTTMKIAVCIKQVPTRDWQPRLERRRDLDSRAGRQLRDERARRLRARGGAAAEGEARRRGGRLLGRAGARRAGACARRWPAAPIARSTSKTTALASADAFVDRRRAGRGDEGRAVRPRS